MNAEFQRIARRDKKVFLSNQCKEVEENNRMGKARDLFKKIRDTRKMVMITLYAKQKKRHRCTEQTFGLCGRRRGWDVLKEHHVYYL